MSLERSGDLNELERRLAGWRPSAGGLDRDRMLYEAGRASARAEARRTATALSGVSLVLAVATTCLGTGWALDRRRDLAPETAPATATTVAPPPAVAPATRPEPPSPTSYLALTRRIVDGRIAFDDLPRSPAPAESSRPAARPLRVGDRDLLLDL